MIYLLSQMGLIILLAVVAGGAIGWIVQRFSTQQTVSDLRRLAAQQMQQVKQAQTDVAMVAQDYDELKQDTSATIDALRKENQRIPQLDQNLEKSQLLVRQLMQKHEAQIREFAAENEVLKSKVKRLDDREKALNKLQADIESSRKAQAKDRSSNNKESADVPVIEDASDVVEINSQTDTVSAADTTKRTTAEARTSTSSIADAEATTSAEKSKKTSQSIADLLAMAQARAKHEKDATAHLVDDEDDDLVGLDGSADVSGEAGSLTVALAEADDVLAAIDRRQARARTLEDDEVIDTSDIDLDAEFADEDEELEQLFDSVDQHDDLQTIFGIGPITERGLNQLGITSYSQLADLKRHDIEKIANALAIVPGKIEREDWVGNARRQLEDVLEEL